MRILLANKFYYNRGGDCTYTLNVQKLLEANVHEVAVFAMDYGENLTTPWQRYFPSEVNFRNVRHPLEAFLRPLGSSEVRRQFGRLLDDFRPDVLHMGNIHSQLSPLIAELAHGRGIRVVWTLHDYKLICPRYDCLRDKANCTACTTDERSVVRHRCVKGSLPASWLGYLEMRKWNLSRLAACTDAFICPSRFMYNLMQQSGIPQTKLVQLHNFVLTETFTAPASEREPYVCYAGRLSPEKGVATLLQAVAELPDVRLKIAGDGPERENLVPLASERIQFLGRLGWTDLQTLVGKAQALVVPSEWYENNPLSVIEALCLGTPVVGAAIGGIPELIDEASGLTFCSGDVSALRDALIQVGRRTFDHAAIAASARARFGADAYYNRLMQVYRPA